MKHNLKKFIVVQLQLSRLSFFAHLYPIPPNSHSQSPPSSMPMSPLFMFLSLFPPPLSVSPPVTVSPSLFPSLWLHSAHLLILFIRFHLQVRYYGICPSLPGPLHPAQRSPVPSMLLQGQSIFNVI